MGLEISLEKWLALSALGIISLIVGLIPYFILRFKREITLRTDSTTYKVILTILSCFGGGVILSTAFLHVLPEVRESIEKNSKLQNFFGEEFPFAEVITLTGFILIYFVEEIASWAASKKVSSPPIFSNGRSHRGNSYSDASQSIMTHATLPLESSPTNSNLFLDGRSTISLVNNDHDHFQECVKDENDNFLSSVRSLMALIALSFHAIFEGIAIGIQSETDVWVMFGAVASHKFVISFCMGMEIMNVQAHFCTFFASIGFFSIVSPIGILIGAAISSETASPNSLIVIILQGLVCGTLIYVVFFEILNRERERKTTASESCRCFGFIQLAAVVSGLVIMGCLTLLTHDPDHAEVHYGNSSDALFNNSITSKNFSRYL